MKCRMCRDNNAAMFVRVIVKLRPLCTQCMNNLMRRHALTKLKPVELENGMGEWLAQEVHES